MLATINAAAWIMGGARVNSKGRCIFPRGTIAIVFLPFSHAACAVGTKWTLAVGDHLTTTVAVAVVCMLVAAHIPVRRPILLEEYPVTTFRLIHRFAVALYFRQPLVSPIVFAVNSAGNDVSGGKLAELAYESVQAA